MSLISDAQLASLRSFFGAMACRDDCVITRVTVNTPDGLGSPAGGVTTVGTVKADVAQPGAGLLAEYASQIGSQLTWLVVFPYGTAVRKKDTLTVNGRRMEVQVLLDPNTYEAFQGVLATEIA